MMGDMIFDDDEDMIFPQQNFLSMRFAVTTY